MAWSSRRNSVVSGNKMVAAVFDTNILIDYLNGYKQAEKTLEKYDDKKISVITYIELLAGAKTDEEKNIITALVKSEFEVLDLDMRISEEAADIRSNSILNRNKLKLPDCIVLASANTQVIALVTRDEDAFSDYPNVIVPYRV